ncbi:MAG: aminoacyl-tRNA hydrolase [Candidatus Omnitrophica bacterium]|nr:aminoacyl-tRNA hydrolase [Candidatus Omnitrophota bacterium]
MKLIVGLGNPGLRYRHTKHNAGFWVIEQVAKQLKVLCNKRSFNAHWGQGRFQSENIMLVKPQTFMNLSGQSVARFSEYYKVSPDDILVVFDDIHIPLGMVRIRAEGSAGGHNGMRSVIECLGTDVIARVRLGIGTDERGADLSSYVLSRFKHDEENSCAKAMVETASEAVVCWLEKGIAFAMNRYNNRGRENSDHE